MRLIKLRVNIYVFIFFSGRRDITKITKKCFSCITFPENLAQMQTNKASIIFLRSLFTPNKTAGYSKHILVCLIYLGKVITILISTIKCNNSNKNKSSKPKQFKLPFSRALSRSTFSLFLFNFMTLRPDVNNERRRMTSLMNPRH